MLWRMSISICGFLKNRRKCLTRLKFFATMENESDQFVEIIEGTAKMHYDKKESVFYNKVQVFNRDLSIQVIKLFSEMMESERSENFEKKMRNSEEFMKKFGRQPMPPKRGISVLDALAASGLRSVRYLKEVPLLRSITVNDILAEATLTAKSNCILNNIDANKIELTTGDATMLMYNRRSHDMQFDVIDLDPYGSVTPFLDAAVQAVADGGLLCVTCTDTAVLAGTYPEKCYSHYGSMPLKAGFKHEMSLRILLNAIESAANRYHRYIEPWLSVSIDYYVRVFVRVRESAAEVKKSCLKRAMVFQSSQSPSFHVVPVGVYHSDRKLFGAGMSRVPGQCEETGGSFKVGGPYWIEELHRQDVVDELLSRVKRHIKLDPACPEALNFPIPTSQRVGGVLASIADELKDVPFYYVLPMLSGIVNCTTPPRLEFISALHNAGFRSSQFHHEPDAVKTDAPPSVVWDIIRRYAQLHPSAGKREKPAVAKTILEKEIRTDVDFTTVANLAIQRAEQSAGLARFPPNPEKNWGPKQRAGRATKSDEHVEKKAKIL